MPIFRLAVASPLRRFFDYYPPAGLDTKQLATIQPGARIKVPFGRRSRCAILVEQVQDTAVAEDKLREAGEVLDAQPLINRPLLKLCLWAAGYYQHPPGEVLRATLPPSLRNGQPYQPVRQTCWRLSIAGRGLPEGAPRRAPRQARLLELLRETGNMDRASLEQAGISPAVLRQAAGKGLVEAVHLEPAHTPAVSRPGLDLNAEQRVVVREVAASLGSFQCFLLEGITGSGKTEVYLQLIARVLAAGQQVLLLLPEIGLTPQTLQRFQRRFAANIVVLHSNLTDKARERAWDEARSGCAHIVMGTRSAVFANIANLGLIVVDEEHDQSFKQQDGFRYSARDVAVKRGQLDQAPVLLGSATPSLESLANAERGRYRQLRLTQRATAAGLPQFIPLDIRGMPLQAGLSEPLLSHISENLAAGEQVLLFLNRRGYAPTLQCHHCGFVAGCAHCDARLTLHRKAAQLRCHHCGWSARLYRECPECQSRQLMISGLGTEQVEETLLARFPAVSTYRVDRDSMQRRGAMDAVFEAVSSGAPCILLGTQMLTKGHHFPEVTLVGLVDVDAALFSSDFRGPERLGQLLTQVSGRAGRENKPGRVVLQTHYPDHPLLQTLLRDGYGKFARNLLEQRRAVGMPPFGHLLLLRAEAGQAQDAQSFLDQVRDGYAGAREPGVTCIGPLPAPMPRRKNRFRSQLLVVANTRALARRSARQLVYLAEALPAGKALRWSLDVDPQDLG